MKKIRVVHWMVLSAPVLLAAQLAFSDTAADLKQAEELHKAGQYTLAEQVYLKVASEADPNNPAAMEAAFNARRKLPLIYLATERQPQAKEAVQQLLSKYAQHQSLPHALHEIVEQAKALNKTIQAGQLYENILATQPQHPQAIWLKMSIAIASVHLGDDKAAEAMLQNLTARHAADRWAAEALNHVAWAYRKLEDYEKARTIYRYVLDNWPAKARTAFAQHGLIICDLGLNDRQAADAALDVLLQKYSDDPNLPNLVLWAAYEYSHAGEFEAARELHEFLIENYPSEAVNAQVGLALTGVEAKDGDQIEAAVQSLLTQFPPSEAKATGLYNVANALAWKEVAYVRPRDQEPPEPSPYSQSLLAIANNLRTTYPGTDGAMWAERDLATVALQNGDDAAAEAAVGRLMADYANHQDMPAALQFVGNHYIRLKRDDKAGAIYQHLVDKHPNHEVMPLAKAGLARIKIRQGDDAAAETIFQKVATDCANSPRLAEAVDMIAEGYLLRAAGQSRAEKLSAPGTLQEGLSTQVKTDYLRAIEKWESILSRPAPDPYVAGVACYSAAAAYLRLGEYDSAIGKCTQLLERWPEHDDAWRAQFLMAKVYKRQMREATADTSETQLAMRQALEQLVQRYPACPAAPGVLRALQASSNSGEGGQK